MYKTKTLIKKSSEILPSHIILAPIDSELSKDEEENFHIVYDIILSKNEKTSFIDSSIKEEIKNLGFDISSPYKGKYILSKNVFPFITKIIKRKIDVSLSPDENVSGINIWYCGYVSVPIKHLCFNSNVSDFYYFDNNTNNLKWNIIVHGGITFTGRRITFNEKVFERKNHTWIGFDTNHYGSNKNPEFAEKETQNLRRQLEKIYIKHLVNKRYNENKI